MDRILPSMAHKDRNGLPCFPPHIENQIIRTFYSGLDPSPDMEALMDVWIWNRAAVIRDAKAKHAGTEQGKAALELGWEGRKDSMKQKRHTNEDSRADEKDTSMGGLEIRAEKWERL